MQPGDVLTVQDLLESHIHYIHDGSETETDSFEFTLRDGGENGVAPVTGVFQLQINDIVDPIPDLTDSTISVLSGGRFDSIDNDSSQAQTAGGSLIDQSVLGDGVFQVEITTQPMFGSIVLNDDGSFVYTHDGSDNLDDFFVYTVTNHDGASVSARVSVTAEPAVAAALNSPFIDNTPVIVAPVSNASAQESVIESGTDEVVQTEDSEEMDQTAQDGGESSNEVQAEADPFTEITEFSAEAAGTGDSADSVERVTVTSEFNLFDGFQESLLVDGSGLNRLAVQKHNVFETVFFTDQSSSLTVNSIDLVIDQPLSVSEVVNSRQFLRGLSSASTGLETAQEETLRQIELGGEVAFSISISTTAGVLAWMLRGGALFGSMMAATPLWSSIDPMRVTSLVKDSDSKPKDDVEKIFESGS